MKTIYSSDINVLLQLYAPRDYALSIFDPFGKLQIDDKIEWERGTAEKMVIVNLGKRITEYRGIPIQDFDLVINFGRQSESTFSYKRDFQFINDLEGRIRWYYPKHKIARVLPFYNTSSTRGKLIALAIRTIQSLGLANIFSSGRVQIAGKSELKFDTLNSLVPEQVYSVFTGARSVQRSAVVALFSDENLTDFLKVPVKEGAFALAANEKQALKQIKQQNFQSFKYPEDQALHPYILRTKNLAQNEMTKSNTLSPLHIDAILEISGKNQRTSIIETSSFWNEIQSNCKVLEQNNDPKNIALSKNLRKLISREDSSASFLTTSSHGDFTPWNILVGDNEIAIFDWEHYRSNAPALFDLFHFIYQRGILIERKSAQEIRNICKAQIESSPQLSQFLKTYALSFEMVHSMYLLHISSYYGARYTMQPKTIQHNWQIETWTHALQLELANSKKITDRQELIISFNRYLNQLPHAYLKFNFQSLASVPESSDLDLALLKENREQVISFFKENVHGKVQVQRKSFMTIIEIYFENQEFLSIDLIHDFRRKNLRFLDIFSLLNETKRNHHGVQIPALKHDLLYAFSFYALNGETIPTKYWNHFINRDLIEKHEALHYLNEQCAVDLWSLEDVFVVSPQRAAEKISQSVKQLNKGSLRQLKLSLQYVIDTLRSVTLRRGFIITFSGVDGAGKSTIINSIQSQLANKYRKEIVQLRHRPGILPMLNSFRVGKAEAEQLATDNLPRQGQNKSRLSSLVRFTYYFIDYIIGQFYIYFKYILRGKIVVFDRYYFDFIADAKRSNIQLNPALVKALYTVILKPKLNFFLYADSSVILQRKKELDATTIDTLSNKYKSLFDELNKKSNSSKYIAIENLKLQKTISSVINEFQKVA